MTRRPLASRAPIRPIANPPTRLPTPIAASSSAYPVFVSRWFWGASDFWTNTYVNAVRVPIANWANAAWIVFAKRTGSRRRNVKPSPISARIDRLPAAGAALVGVAAGRAPERGDGDRRDEDRRRAVRRGVDPERERQGRAEERHEQAGERDSR